MSSLISGRAAVVTGSSSGIGRSIAQQLGKAGMEIWLVGRSETALQTTADTITKSGGPQPHLVPLDISESGSLARVIGDIEHSHLYAVINCAGVMYPEPILDGEPARWREMFEINVLAVLEASQAAVRKMRAQGAPGHIINFSSVAARWDAGGVYGATKIALEMITRTLRQEVERDDIRVTAIVPGGFATQLSRGFKPETLEALMKSVKSLDVPMEKLMGDPAHIARLVQYILEQPIDINMSEVVIRPPVDLTF